MKVTTRLLALCFCALLLTFSCKENTVVVPDDYVNESFYVRNNKADLYTSARGNRFTNSIIINIHGGPAQGVQLIGLLRPITYQEIEKQGIVIYYDQRGIGLSTGNFKKNTLSLDQYVDDLNAIVEICKHKYGSEKKIFLLSRSWGGLVAAEYLVHTELQKKIAGWMNVSGAYDLPKILDYGQSNLLSIANEQIALDNSATEWRGIRDFAIGFDTTNHSWDNLNQLWIKGSEGMKLLENDHVLVENTQTTGLNIEDISGSTAYSFFEASQNDWQEIPEIIMKPLLNYSPKIENIEIPTLFISGEKDLIVPSNLTQIGFEEISTPLKDKYLHIYSNQGHFPMGDVEKFTLHFNDFIQTYQ